MVASVVPLSVWCGTRLIRRGGRRLLTSSGECVGGGRKAGGGSRVENERRALTFSTSTPNSSVPSSYSLPWICMLAPASSLLQRAKNDPVLPPNAKQKNIGETRTRTRDLVHAKQALYHLSHFPVVVDWPVFVLQQLTTPSANQPTREAPPLLLLRAFLLHILGSTPWQQDLLKPFKATKTSSQGLHSELLLHPSVAPRTSIYATP